MRRWGRRKLVRLPVEPHTVIVLDEYLSSTRDERRAMRLADPETFWHFVSTWEPPLLTDSDQNAGR